MSHKTDIFTRSHIHAKSDIELVGICSNRLQISEEQRFQTLWWSSPAKMVLINSWVTFHLVTHHFYPVRFIEDCWSLSKGSPSQRHECTLDHPPVLWLTHTSIPRVFCWYSDVRQTGCRSYSLFQCLSLFYHSFVLGSPSEFVKGGKSGVFWHIFCRSLQWETHIYLMQKEFEERDTMMCTNTARGWKHTRQCFFLPKPLPFQVNS